MVPKVLFVINSYYSRQLHAIFAIGDISKEKIYLNFNFNLQILILSSFLIFGIIDYRFRKVGYPSFSVLVTVLELIWSIPIKTWQCWNDCVERYSDNHNNHVPDISSLYKKWSFPLRIFSVNVIKSTGNPVLTGIILYYEIK